MSKTNIFTISIYNLTSDCEFECCESWDTYYAIDDAIDAASRVAKELSNEDDVYDITIFGGEYQNDNGDTFGEPFGIIAISNKDKETTKEARLAYGFVVGEMDGYVTYGEVELNIDSFIKNNFSNNLEF